MKTLFATTAAIGAALAVGWNVDSLRSEIDPPRPASGLGAHQTHASASLMGQFRTSASTWLWLKTDLYLHNGVEMRPLTEAEQTRGKRAIRDGDGWHAAIGDESSTTTVVPSKEADFRGVFGELERATSAYSTMDGHLHSDPRSALPLFRLMTWVDPQFIEGWTTGAMVLASDRSEDSTRKALGFLFEGLRHNEASIEVRSMIAQLLAGRMHRIDQAIGYLDEAVEIAESNFEELPESERAAALDAFRWLAMCHSENGATTKSVDVARRGLSRFDKDAVLLRQANPSPALFINQREAATQPFQPDLKTQTHTHGPGCNHKH